MKFLFAVHEAGKGGFVQSEFKGKKMVWRVNSLSKTEEGKFKLTAMYIVNDSKKVKIKTATHFMEEASNLTIKKALKVTFKSLKSKW